MRLYYILFLIFLSGNFSVFSQEYHRAYKAFDNYVNKENTNLFYGKEYIEQHAIINNKHKFFKTSNFLNGSVVYSNQIYHDIVLKYNVFEDLLVVKISKQGGDATFELFKNRIQSFIIDGHNFINVQPDNNSVPAGFYEVLREDTSLKLLKNHRKQIEKIFTKDFTYFEFEPEQALYAVSISGKYFELNSQQDWVKAFTEYSEDIESFFDSNKSLKENDPDSFMIRLFLKISDSYKPNNS